jgi:glycosyltransferase involved in cell wall biosynthesis
VVGEAGLSVEPRNAAAIRQKLEELIHSDQRRSELAAAARKRVQMFSWQNIAEKYVECYESVIAKATNRR